MAFRFEDWSKIVSQRCIEELYQEKGFLLPGGDKETLVKVFLDPPTEESLEELKHWENERELKIDPSKASQREDIILLNRVHIDLYGPALTHCPEKGVLNSEEIKKRIRKERDNINNVSSIERL